MLILAGLAAVLVPTIRSAAISFLAALLLAGFLQKPMDKLAALHIPRWLAALLFLAGFLVPMLFLTLFGVQTLIHSIQSVLQQLPPLLQAEDSIDNWLYRKMTALPPEWQAACAAVLETVIARREELISRALSLLGTWSSDWITSLPGQLAGFGLFFLTLFLCCIGYREVCALGADLLPAEWTNRLRRMNRLLSSHIHQWLTAESKLVALVFSELALGLAALRQSGWIWCALLIALIDMIPMIGSGLVFAPWSAVRWLLNDRLGAVALLLLWAIVWVTRTVLEPKLVGRHLQIPTVLSFCSAILGVKVWGFKGLIAFPVLTAAAINYLKHEKSGAAHKGDTRSQHD